MAKDTMDGLIERKNKKGETIGLQLRITVGSKGGYIWLTKSVRYNPELKPSQARIEARASLAIGPTKSGKSMSIILYCVLLGSFQQMSIKIIVSIAQTGNNGNRVRQRTKQLVIYRLKRLSKSIGCPTMCMMDNTSHRPFQSMNITPPT